MIELDEPCGRHWTYRDLLHVGKTWRDHAARGKPIDNLPREAATVAALSALAANVLDALAAEFGSVEITYGFASLELTRHIKAGIAPALDQHAAYELRPDGRQVCGRGGAAVDLVVPGRRSTEVARWIHANLPFDRMYVYGDERPLHVSHGPTMTRAVVVMVAGPSGRRVPRRVVW